MQQLIEIAFNLTIMSSTTPLEPFSMAIIAAITLFFLKLTFFRFKGRFCSSWTFLLLCNPSALFLRQRFFSHSKRLIRADLIRLLTYAVVSCDLYPLQSSKFILLSDRQWINLFFALEFRNFGNEVIIWSLRYHVGRF